MTSSHPVFYIYLTLSTRFAFTAVFSKSLIKFHFLFTSFQVENGDQLEAITVSPGMHQMMIQGAPGQEPQVLQVVSLKDATLLSKAMEAITSGNVKADDTIIMEQ